MGGRLAIMSKRVGSQPFDLSHLMMCRRVAEKVSWGDTWPHLGLPSLLFCGVPAFSLVLLPFKLWAPFLLFLNTERKRQNEVLACMNF